MKFTVAPKRHSAPPDDNRTNFLLAGAKVQAKVGFSDGSFKTVDGVKGGGPGEFVVEVRAGDFPPGAIATMIDLTYTVSVKLGGRMFTALTVAQRLSARLSTGGGPPDYVLAAAGWHDAQGRLRIANLKVHPLVDASRLSSARVEVNTLILDITDGWLALHAGNPFYVLYNELTVGSDLTMRVFAHTAGVPLIWHAVIPGHLGDLATVSPHIFLQPSDNREGQNLPNDEAYLTKNDKHFEDDGSALMKYIVPPVPDVDVKRIRPNFRLAPYWRNVLCIARIPDGPKKGQITPLQWFIPAGLQKAFGKDKDSAPAQFLLLPQRFGIASSRKSGPYEAAVNANIVRTTDAILGLIQTNTMLTDHRDDTLIKRGKFVYSGYSESGYDLWNVGRALGDQLKAVIAVEPQNLNEIAEENDYRPKVDGVRKGEPPAVGKDVIPTLLKKGVKVYIIGRHQDHYHPKVPSHKLLRLLPDNPTNYIKWRPDPGSNQFIKYRLQRLVDPSIDPLMDKLEKAILDTLATRGITGKAALAAILTDETNRDEAISDLLQRWYSHQFALSGGDELTIGGPTMYGTPVTYRTWFQVAVREIG